MKIAPQYKDQVGLLLDILPIIAKKKCFALKGGTALNLFIWNMPRLSVDIDLVYLPINDRNDAFKDISANLASIKNDLENILRIKAHLAVNRELILLYFNIGNSILKK